MRVGIIRTASTTAATPAVTLWSAGEPAGTGVGHDIVMGPGSAIVSVGAVQLFVQDDFTMDQTALISATQRANLFTDFNQTSSQVGPGSTVDIAGAIKSPIENIFQLELGTVPLNDTISLTNVQQGTVATITMEPAPTGQPGFRNTINLGSLTPFNGGQLSAIAGPITVDGSGLDRLELDDSGDPTSWTGVNEPTITATAVTGMGMGTPTGVVYSGLANLILELGGAAQTINVLSTAANPVAPTGATVTEIAAHVDGNTWNVGSLAPTTTGGVLAGIQGTLVLFGVGTNDNATDTLNLDDSGSTGSESGTLTEFDYGTPENYLTGLGMGPGGHRLLRGAGRSEHQPRAGPGVARGWHQQRPFPNDHDHRRLVER